MIDIKILFKNQTVVITIVNSKILSNHRIKQYLIEHILQSNTAPIVNEC